MTLQSSSVITAAQVNTELGRTSTAAINLNEATVRHLAAKPSAGAAISMNDLWGRGRWRQRINFRP